jgi:hypothetical protein
MCHHEGNEPVRGIETEDSVPCRSVSRIGTADSRYAMMIGGAAMFALGTVLLIREYEASRAMNSTYIDCDRDVTRVGLQLAF